MGGFFVPCLVLYLTGMKELTQYLLALLAKREYTVKQLREKAEKKFPELSVEEQKESIGWLKEKNYVSDERFTESFIRQAIRKGDGPMKIQQKLTQKGVSKDIVTGYLSQVEADDQYKSALEAGQKKYPSIAQKEPDVFQQRIKLTRFLVGRGFGYDVIQRVVDNIM